MKNVPHDFITDDRILFKLIERVKVVVVDFNGEEYSIALWLPECPYRLEHQYFKYQRPCNATRAARRLAGSLNKCALFYQERDE